MKASELKAAFPGLSDAVVRGLIKDFNHAISEGPELIERALQAASELIGGFGVEALQPENAHVDEYWFSTVALYVNMGDAYAKTILYDTENGTFEIGSWGDFIEAWELERIKDDEGEEGEEAVSWKAEVQADESGEWTGNMMRFPTKKSAEEYALNLASRWTAVRNWRVLPSDDPVTEPL